ncbi:MAG: cellulase family glycosylhydrolase [Myxococcales bacterium]|nr:cellulase family glycosylhydrolase [Myxococcales bacterium]
MPTGATSRRTLALWTASLLVVTAGLLAVASQDPSARKVIGPRKLRPEAGLLPSKTFAELAADPFGVIPGSLGVTSGLGLNEDDMRMIRDAGIRYIRVGLRWEGEVEQVRGSYNWRKYDTMGALAKKHGLKPIYLLAYTNDLYNTDEFMMNEPAEHRGFAAFAAAAVKRYDGPGVIWEVGNEQDTAKFWPVATPKNSPKSARERAVAYMQMAKIAVPAMRAASSRALIITGGVLDTTWRVTRAWLDEVFKRGALKLFDGVGIHAYGRPMLPAEHKLIEGLVGLRKLITKYGGRADFPIYQTEAGIGIHNNDTSGPISDRLVQQAQANVRLYLISQMLGLKLNVWYEWHDKRGAGDERGLLAPDRTPRPVYTAASVLVRQLRGYGFKARLDLGNRDDFALVFSNGKHRRMVAWTAGDAHEATVRLPDFPNRLTVTSMMGTPRTVTKSGPTLTVRLTASPIYVSAAR